MKKFVKQGMKINKLRMNCFSDLFKDKEKVEEKLYIEKHERELMKKLLEKLETKGELDQPTTIHDHHIPDRNRVREIFKKHNMNASNKLVDALIRWKRGLNF
jgi:hypothetical protein